MKSFFLGFLFLGLSANVFAGDLGGCKNIKYKKGRVYQIKAQLYKGTHIKLPERLAMNPITGNDLLWDVEGKGHHVMVKPNSNQEEGKETTLTLITQSNKSYNFILRRVLKKPDTCVVIEETGTFFKGVDTAGYKTSDELEILELEHKIADLNQRLKKQAALSDEIMEEAIKKYRSFIYTRYKWGKGTGFKGKNLILDVYDDGRYTFIRVADDQRGVLAITAELDGNQEMIEYRPDAENIYRIAGIYPLFKLKYGKSSVTIKRKDNLSNGAY